MPRSVESAARCWKFDENLGPPKREVSILLQQYVLTQFHKVEEFLEVSG